MCRVFHSLPDPLPSLCPIASINLSILFDSPSWPSCETSSIIAKSLFTPTPPPWPNKEAPRILSSCSALKADVPRSRLYTWVGWQSSGRWHTRSREAHSCRLTSSLSISAPGHFSMRTSSSLRPLGHLRKKASTADRSVSGDLTRSDASLLIHGRWVLTDVGGQQALEHQAACLREEGI